MEIHCLTSRSDSFPMAKRALRTSKALNFMYEISTEEFVQSNIGPDIKQYAADFVVDRHLEYPDIPPSIWTVTLSITHSNGEISETVEPRAGPESLRNPNLVLVEWRIRRTGNTSDGGRDLFGGDCHWHIGPDGFTRGLNESSSQLVSASSSQLMPGRFDGKRKSHHVLVSDARVAVSLTFTVQRTTASRGLETLYNTGMLADCTLVCGEQDFSAHRAILAAQSPVFAAMFQNEMKEKSSGICTIKDIRSDVLDALLQYVYTRELAKADGKLEALWIAADKYDIQDLKIDCENLILRSMSDGNALGYLIFAAQRGLNKIVVEAAKVIAQRPV